MKKIKQLRLQDFLGGFAEDTKTPIDLFFETGVLGVAIGMLSLANIVVIVSASGVVTPFITFWFFFALASVLDTANTKYQEYRLGKLLSIATHTALQIGLLPVRAGLELSQWAKSKINQRKQDKTTVQKQTIASVVSKIKKYSNLKTFTNTKKQVQTKQNQSVKTKSNTKQKSSGRYF
jgi:hypothetical protein